MGYGNRRTSLKKFVFVPKQKKRDCRKDSPKFFRCVPGRSNNSVVKVHYALGSSKREPKVRGSAVRRNLKGTGCQSKELRRANSRTDEQEPHSRPHNDEQVCSKVQSTKSDAARIPLRHQPLIHDDKMRF